MSQQTSTTTQPSSLELMRTWKQKAELYNQIQAHWKKIEHLREATIILPEEASILNKIDQLMGGSS